jgi:hypothetical protein
MPGLSLRNIEAVWQTVRGGSGKHACEVVTARYSHLQARSGAAFVGSAEMYKQKFF